MEELVELYSPHPGFGGALVPLPKSMKEIANALDGQTMTLEEAMKKITLVAEKLGGSAEISKNYEFISFEFGGRTVTHSYKLIKYRKV